MGFHRNMKRIPAGVRLALAVLPVAPAAAAGAGSARAFSDPAPAVVCDRLVLFHRVGDEERVECLHRETGQRFWSFAYPTTYADRYGWSDGPRVGPTIGGERVFTYGVEGKLHCLDLQTGRVVW